MGTWTVGWWENTASAVPKRDRRSGEYRAYVPEKLVGFPLSVDAETDTAVAAAERAVRALDGRSRDLAGISRFLLRSEAIASSRIEGIAPTAKQVALAELGQSERVQGVGAQAQAVANNMTVVRDATTRLVGLDVVTPEDIVGLHATLLPAEPRHHGIREVQNWIGGSDWHPLDADFVPPPAERVEDLMRDICEYLVGAVHSPLVQAALVHAQFETIHPFTDGNGRVGRALIHTVLARRGLTTEAILPISLVLSTLSDQYIAGLTTYRAESTDGGENAVNCGRSGWIRVFAESTLHACEQASRIAEELADIRQEWSMRLEHHRENRGTRKAVRSDSATALVLENLAGAPVLTVGTVQRIHGVSRVAAERALEELDDAGILQTRSIGTSKRAYLCSEVLETITWAQRRLASTKFDTRHSTPHAGVPAAPC